MTPRVLPREEWHRAAHLPIAEAFATLPEDTQLLVVEDEAGVIVGTWAVVRYVHVHGFWIAEAHRRRGSVLRRLLQGLKAAAGRWHTNVVLTSATDVDVADMVIKYGGRPLPGVPLVFPVGGKR